jgi:hypothetical protein
VVSGGHAKTIPDRFRSAFLVGYNHSTVQFSVVLPFLKFSVIPVLAWVGFMQTRHVQRNWLGLAAHCGTGFVLLFSTLLLVLSLPTGSLDISNLWPFLVWGLAPSVPLLGFWLARNIKALWLKVSVRAVASLLIIPTGLFLLLMCLVESACTRRTPPIYSPDGGYVALVEFYVQGALGEDSANVSVRRAWTPIATKAYSGSGAWYGDHRFQNSPEVHWLDPSHLLIRDWDGRSGNEGKGGPPICKDKVASLHIVCENLAFTRPKMSNLRF